MKLMESEQYRSDIEKVVNHLKFLSDLRESTILITGSTGLIGSTIVDLLTYMNEYLNTNIKIYACGRDKKKFQKRFQYNENLFFISYDATKSIDFNFTSDYIIHCASNASPNLYVSNPVETIDGNYFGMRNLLDYGREVKSKKIVYVSSSEIYGVLENKNPLQEDDEGYIDILKPRSSYAMSKRLTETLCASYSKEYNVNVSIARPGHVYGPAAKKNDLRVVSLFIRKALNHEVLVMKSNGEQIRSYTYSIDCASAILTILLRGQNSEAYNISNKKSILTIKDMANLIAKYGDTQLVLDFSKNEKMFNPMTNSSLNSNKLDGIGWCGLFTASIGISHTLNILS